MITEQEALLVYNGRIKVRANGFIEFREYSKPLSKIKEGWEDIEKDSDNLYRVGKKGHEEVYDLEKEEFKQIRMDSLIRSRDLIIDYASQNAKVFHSFITLTFADNVTDLTEANKKFKVFIDQMRRLCKALGTDFYYLGVPEFQKRGAVHYHLLTSLVCGSELLPLQEGQTDMYNVKYWNHGFSSAYNLDMTDKNFNVALYLTKYLFKDLDERLFGRTRVLKSNNLVKPDTYYLLKDSETYKKAKEYIKEKYDVEQEFVYDNNVLDRNPNANPYNETSFFDAKIVSDEEFKPLIDEMQKFK